MAETTKETKGDNGMEIFIRYFLGTNGESVKISCNQCDCKHNKYGECEAQDSKGIILHVRKTTRCKTKEKRVVKE